MKQISDKDLAQITKYLKAYLNTIGPDWKRAELRRKVSLLIKKLDK